MRARYHQWQATVTAQGYDVNELIVSTGLDRGNRSIHHA